MHTSDGATFLDKPKIILLVVYPAELPSRIFQNSRFWLYINYHFQHGSNELLKEAQHIQWPGSSHFVADVDGDGDVDVVHAFSDGFAYAEQRNGRFVVLKSYDNPFFPGFWVVLLLS